MKSIQIRLEDEQYELMKRMKDTLIELEKEYSPHLKKMSWEMFITVFLCHIVQDDKGHYVYSKDVNVDIKHGDKNDKI